jgi:TBC1 domain family member 24
VRRGVPDPLRQSVWKLITGCSDIVAENADFYDRCLAKTFGDNVPDEFLTVPMFGGQMKPQDHYLSANGLKVAQRVLCVLQSNHADIEYLPVIPDLTCLLLTFMSERDTYVTLHAMCQASRSSTEHIIYFRPTKKEVHVFINTFENLLKKRIKKVFQKMKELGVSCHDFADEWFMRLFLNDFPFQACLRIFDAYLGEGQKILFRVALAHLKICQGSLLRASTAEEFVGIIRQRAAQTPNPVNLLKKAFEIQLQRKDFHRYNEKNRAKITHVVEPQIPVYYKPIIRQPSVIISDLQFELLFSWLPNRFGIEDPVKLYSSDQEGYSLKHFIDKMAQLPSSKQTPTIFITKSTKGEVFGAFLGVHAAWEFSKGRSFSGERDCFLWTFVPESMKFGWYEGCADYFLHIDRDRGISIGGGNGTGLHIDNEMNNGTTQKCDTFNNKPLTHDERENFQLAAFEVYGFEEAPLIFSLAKRLLYLGAGSFFFVCRGGVGGEERPPLLAACVYFLLCSLFLFISLFLLFDIFTLPFFLKKVKRL